MKSLFGFVFGLLQSSNPSMPINPTTNPITNAYQVVIANNNSIIDHKR